MRDPYRVTLFAENRSAETGSITVPLLLLSMVLGAASFSTLGYAMLWQSKVKLQLRLDRCVESVAKELIEIQDGIESGNLRMNAERIAAAAAAAPTFGQSLNAVKPVLLAEEGAQEALRLRWILRQSRWVVSRGCDARSDLFLPLPSLKWSRPPMDSIGERPLEWDSKDTKLTIRLWRENRFSQARVMRAGEKSENENEESTGGGSPLTGGFFHHWNAAWIRRPGT